MNIGYKNKPQTTPAQIHIVQSQTDTPLPGLSSFPQYLKTPSGLLLIGCLTVLGILALLEGNGKAKLATSRWAKGREQRRAFCRAINQMRARKHNEVALSIGLLGERRSQHFPDLQRAMAVVGAPGSGKTFSIINPLLVSSLLQGFPTIVYDFKYPKQAADLLALAKHLDYDVHVFAPGFPESEVCNLLDFMQDEADIALARQIAKVIYRNSERSGGSSRTDDSFFSDAGEQAIVGGLSFAKSTPYPDIAMVQAILSRPELAERLQHAPDIPLWTRVNFDQLMAVAGSEKTAASIIGTAAGYCTRFMAPTLLSAFLGKTTLPLDVNSKQLIVIGMDKERRDAIAPLLATVLHMLIVRNFTRSRETPLVVAIDELPTLYLPDLIKWINEHREQGLALILGFQNLAQLEKTYDKATARAIFGACASKALFNPGETESAQLFASYLGDEEVRYTDTARSRGGGRTTINRSPQRRTRKLFEPSQFLKLPAGSAVLISPGFAGKRQGSLPVRRNIKVPPAVIRLIERSKNAWPRLEPLLIQRRAEQPVTGSDLKARTAHAEAILPTPTSNDELLRRAL